MALLLRSQKAAPLTADEQDDNLLYLDNRITSIDNLKLDIADLLISMKLVDGINSGLDADLLRGYGPQSVNAINSLVLRDGNGNFSAGTITASLTGTASHAITADGLVGTLGIASGGTGASSLAVGVIFSNGSYLVSSPTVPGSVVSGSIPGNAQGLDGILGVLNGGTGATNVQGAQANLGLVIGQTIQGYSSNLQSMSSVTGSGILHRTSSGGFGVRMLISGDGIVITNPTLETGSPIISISNVGIPFGGTGASTPSQALANLGGMPSHNANMTGIPIAPTAAAGTETNQVATCKFVVDNGVPVGTIIELYGPGVPTGYLQMTGAAVSRVTYAKLFARIGTTAGPGDGSTTFNIPYKAPTATSIFCIKV